ncbi:MAG: phage major tail protein, TP901-1 family [Devosiaceae bacterium]
MMTAFAGRTLLLKTYNSTTDQFEAVGGLRARALDLVQELVNTTHGESEGRWRELLGDAGLRHGKITGSGLFRDSASDARVRALFFDGTVAQWQVIIPDFGTIEGPFLVSALDYSGRHDDAITFEITLESAGVLAFSESA